MGRGFVLCVLSLLTACATLTRDPDLSRVVIDQARSSGREQDAERAQHQRAARDAYLRAAAKAHSAGDYLLAYAIHKRHIRDPKRLAAAREAVIAWVLGKAREVAPKDAIEALRVIAALMNTTELAPPWSRVRPVFELAADRAWAQVLNLAARHHYIPAVAIARGIAELTPGDDAYSTSLRRIKQQAAAFHRGQAARAGGRVWSRYFHQMMASHFGPGERPRTPQPNRKSAVADLRCPFTGDTLASKVDLPGRGLELQIQVRSCEMLERIVERDGTVAYTEKVPVYRTEYDFVEHKTSGFIPSMGQTEPCIATKNGKCTARARVAARDPKPRPSTYVEVKSRRVIDHYKTVTRHRPGKVKVAIGELSGRGVATIKGPGVRSSFAFSAVGKDRDDLENKLAGVIEARLPGVLRQHLDRYRARIRTSRTDDQREDAEIAAIVATGDKQLGATLLERYGSTDFVMGPPSGGAFVWFGLPIERNPEVPEAEQAIQRAKSPFVQIAPRARVMDALAAHDYYDFSRTDGNGDYYYPPRTITAATSLGSSPLIDTDLAQIFELGFFARNLLETTIQLGSAALVGDATTVGGSVQLRVPRDGSSWRLGLHFQYQAGTEPSDPMLDRPTSLLFGPGTSYEIRVDDKLLVEPYLRLNLLQVTGSDGPYGRSKSTPVGTRIRYNLWRAWWLQADGAAHLGAQDTWTWSIGIGFDDSSQPPIDPDELAKRL